MPYRYLLMAAGMVCLVAGMIAGLLRLNINLFLINPTLAGMHGPLMVSGFLGTVIGLERAVALGRGWGYLAPMLSGLGGLLILLGGPEKAGAALFLLSALVMIAIYAAVLRRQAEIFNVTMALGAVSWGMANGLWLAGWPIPNFVLFWGGFVVLTIAGERLELSRFVEPPAGARRVFMALLGVLLAGMAVSLFNPVGGTKGFGAAMAAIAGWLVVYDLARRTVKQEGLTRFVAMSLLPGYFWLFVSGVLLLAQPDGLFGQYYDAIIHSLFLGFAFSMIFGHAPIIFPAVLKVAVPYSPLFYIHLAALHVSIALRVVSNVLDLPAAHTFAGELNVAAIVLFLLNTVIAVLRGRKA